MAEREAGKARKRTAKATGDVRPASGAAAAIASNDLQAKVEALEADRSRLIAELDAAKARIAELERAREQVLNRIDWVIDSLHNLVEE